ncbi:hypothetical protein HDU87_002246 [Geranomyces variabilis]|uniref:RRM domain-containing protein n=1 Tax=Geranomyces variabilis TaxID=109894 RepID=A0AAD5TRD1_9FUNG|nr:hypothetical protein HDU87_002246 [Geranomyces variabilis]
MFFPANFYYQPYPMAAEPPRLQSSSAHCQSAESSANVYIRNLPEEMSDEELLRIAQRFGTVLSSKSIIDRATGACRGYGFVLYDSAEVSKVAIAGFADLGFAASIARDTTNTRAHLATFEHHAMTARRQSSEQVNVYLANLPPFMSEKDVYDMLTPFRVFTTKILKDRVTGATRGVGFARFHNHADALVAIKHFNNAQLPGSIAPLQARFAERSGQPHFLLVPPPLGPRPRPLVAKRPAVRPAMGLPPRGALPLDEQLQSPVAQAPAVAETNQSEWPPLPSQAASNPSKDEDECPSPKAAVENFIREAIGLAPTASQRTTGSNDVSGTSTLDATEITTNSATTADGREEGALDLDEK